MALPLQVYLLTDSPAALGLLALVQLLPTLLVSLYGGLLADAYDRRKLLVLSELAMAAAALALFALSFVDDAPLWLVLLLGGLIVAAFSIEHPARSSAVPRLVPPERLTAAIALVTLNFQASSVIGPAIAAALIALFGLPGAYGLLVAAYVWAAVASFAMPPLPPVGVRTRPSLSSLREGLRFTLKRPLILATFAIDLNAMIFALPIALLPVLAIDVYAVGAAGVGLLAAARGAGAFGAAVFSGWIPRFRRSGEAVLAAVALFSIATIVLGLATFSFPIALLALATCGATDVVSAVFRNAIVQREIPDDLRGRVVSIHVLVVGSGPRFGDLRAALMAQAFGPQVAVVAGGLIALAGVGVVAKLFPDLPRYRAPIEAEAAAARAERALEEAEAAEVEAAEADALELDAAEAGTAGPPVAPPSTAPGAPPARVDPDGPPSP